jgi:hypothetical protein
MRAPAFLAVLSFSVLSFGLTGCSLLDLFGGSKDAGFAWTKRASSAHTLNDVAWSGALAVAVGDSGTILTSPDGVAWTKRTAPISAHLAAVSWNGNHWIVAGRFGDVMVSEDGVTWTLGSLESTSSFSSLASSGAGTTVVMGAQGKARTSPEGVVWTTRITGTTKDVYQVVYADSQFMAVGSNGLILNSLDGIAWTQPASGTPNALVSVAFTGTRWVVVSGPGNVHTSTDGVAWTLSCDGCAKAPGWTGLIEKIVWTGTQLVGVGGATFASLDGLSWKRRTDVDEEAWQNAVVWTGTRLIGVGLDGIRTSP